PADQDSLNVAAGGNLLERSTQDVLTIIENKSKLSLNLLRKLVLLAEVLIHITSVLPMVATLSQNSGIISKDMLQQPQLITIRKILKALLSNKEKLQELANTPLNKNCSAVILKKLSEKLRDPGKFLIPCGFSELKCKALANLGASVNLIPLSVWKKLGLPELIPTRMTFELANRAICTPVRIARDVFIPVGKFTFLADFVIVDYESDPRVPLILGRPFLRTARALIDVLGEEMILRDGDERLTLNMRHDTFNYSNQPQKESINLINVFNNLKGCNVLSEKLLDLDSTKDLHPPLHDNQLSGSTTYPLLEEFADELPPEYDDNLQFYIEVDALPSTNNEDKIFNPGILIQEKPIEINTRVVKDKKLAISNASLVFKDFDPPFYEPLFFKEVPKSKMLLLFLSENEEKVFKPGIHTSEKVHSYFIPELSHQGYKVFKINQIFKSLMKNFLFYFGKDTHILAVPHHHFHPLDQFKYEGNWVKLSDLKQALRVRHPMLISSLVFLFSS
nr:reverse transcriptase domain-containing protein [Tanacetum cinerariifolium]